MRKLLVILLALAVGVFLYAENVTVDVSGSVGVKLTLDQSGVDLGSTADITLTWSPLSGSNEATPVSVTFKWSALGDEGATLDSAIFNGNLLKITYVNDSFSKSPYLVSHTLPDTTVPATKLKLADSDSETFTDSDATPSTLTVVEPSGIATYTYAGTTTYTLKAGETVGVGSEYVSLKLKSFPYDVTVYFVDLNKDTTVDATGVDTENSYFEDMLAVEGAYKQLPLVDLNAFFTLYNPNSDKKYEMLLIAGISGKAEDLLKGLSAQVVFGNITEVATEQAFAVSASYGKKLTFGIVDLSGSASLKYSKNTTDFYYSSVKKDGFTAAPSLDVTANVSSDVTISLNGAVTLFSEDFKEWENSLDNVSISAALFGGVSLALAYSADDISDFNYHNLMTVNGSVDLSTFVENVPLTVSGALNLENMSKDYVNDDDNWPVVYTDDKGNVKVADDKVSFTTWHVNIAYEIEKGLKASLYFGTDYFAKDVYVFKYPAEDLYVYYKDSKGKHVELYKEAAEYKFGTSYNKIPKWYLTLSYSTSF